MIEKGMSIRRTHDGEGSREKEREKRIAKPLLSVLSL